MSNRAKWIVGGVFWILFLLSLALYQRNRWVDRVWSTAVWVFLSATVTYFVARSIRNRAIKGTSGYPQWFVRFAYDADDRKERRIKSGSLSLSENDENIEPSRDIKKVQS